jgi:hypothetical protein
MTLTNRTNTQTNLNVPRSIPTNRGSLPVGNVRTPSQPIGSAIGVRPPVAGNAGSLVGNAGQPAATGITDQLRSRVGTSPPVAGNIGSNVGGGNNGLPTNTSGDRIIKPLPNEIPDVIRPVRGNDGRTPPRPGAPSNPSPDEPPANSNTDSPPSNTPVQEPPVLVEEGEATGELVSVDPKEPTAPADKPPVEEAPVEEAPINEAPAIDTATLISDLLSQIVGSVGAAPAAPVELPTVDPAILESVKTAAEDPIIGAAAEPTPEATTVDLEIIDVRVIDAGSLELKVGPRYRIVCRNNSTVELPKFHVSLLVDVGKKLSEKAEVVTVESVGILPGKTQSVDIRLPVEVLKMIPERSKTPQPFDTFAAIVDSDERLAETNEENNVLLLAREAIKPLADAKAQTGNDQT